MLEGRVVMGPTSDNGIPATRPDTIVGNPFWPLDHYIVMDSQILRVLLAILLARHTLPKYLPGVRTRQGIQPWTLDLRVMSTLLCYYTICVDSQHKISYVENPFWPCTTSHGLPPNPTSPATASVSLTRRTLHTYLQCVRT